LREPGAARTWLLRITVNVCRNWRAGRFGTTRRLNEPLDRALRDAAPDEYGGESHDADALDMRQAVMALPIDLRRVVALRFYAGMDSSQIGTILELPAATVRTRLRRALELLRRDLSACETDPSMPRGEGIPNG